MWKEVDYWEVHDETDIDTQLFRGSKTACYKWQRKHGGVVAHVILERSE